MKKVLLLLFSSLLACGPGSVEPEPDPRIERWAGEMWVATNRCERVLFQAPAIVRTERVLEQFESELRAAATAALPVTVSPEPGLQIAIGFGELELSDGAEKYRFVDLIEPWLEGRREVTLHANGAVETHLEESFSEEDGYTAECLLFEEDLRVWHQVENASNGQITVEIEDRGTHWYLETRRDFQKTTICLNDACVTFQGENRSAKEAASTGGWFDGAFPWILNRIWQASLDLPTPPDAGF